MSAMNVEIFQSYLSAVEDEAQSWGRGKDGYEQIRILAEKNKQLYDADRVHYYSLAEYLRHLNPEVTDKIAPNSPPPVDNLKLGLALMTNFAYIVATKHLRGTDPTDIDKLVDLFGKPATIETITEPSFFTNDTKDRKEFGTAAMHIEGTMGILPLQGELETELALQKYQITENGVTFNDFPGHTSLRKEKSRCPANKFFEQMLGSIATICAKDPLLFQRTIDRNQTQPGIIIPVFD